MRTLVVTPTYNEAKNVGEFIESVLTQAPESHILIVDDNSPDGTGMIVKGLSEKDARIHLLSRQKKEGLGRAYVAGFSWGLNKAYDLFVEMDADFSHRPVDLPKLITAAFEKDFIIGSRYISEGGTINWSFVRKLISRAGSMYSRMILGFPVNDWTGGFNAYHRRVLEKIGIEHIQSNGYSFQIELKYRAFRAGFQGIEVPILFAERKFGISKMSWKIVLEALLRVIQIRLRVQ